MDVQACHLGIGDFEALWIGVGIQLAGDGEAGGCGGGGDQLDDGAARDERSATPVLRDVTKQPMLDLVPLGRSGRIMANRDGEPGLIGEFLEFHLP